MSNEYKMPTPAEIQAGIEAGHRLRAEYIKAMFGKGFTALRNLPSRIAHLLHLPAHG